MMTKVFKYIYFSVLLLIISSELQSGIYLVDYSLKSYPSVNARYYLFGNNKLPVMENALSDYKVFDNGSEMAVLYQNCLNVNPSNTSSILIDFDLSLRDDILSSKFTKAKSIIKTIIDNCSAYNAKVGIASFDELVYLNSDFTNDATILSAELNKINSGDGSIPDTGFLQVPLGAINLIRNQPHQRTIIFFSSVNTTLNTDKIVEEAKNNGIKIISVFFGTAIPQNIRDISDNTDGIAILGNDTTAADEPLGLALLAMSRNFQPCDLTWLNQLNCYDTHLTEILVPKYNAKLTFSFNINFENKPRIERVPEYLRFSYVFPGTSKTLNASFTAKNGDITVTDLIIQNPRFAIDSGDITSPVILQKDSTHTVRIKFTPTDSSIVFDSLIIKSNACSGTTILITGGYPNTPPKERTLTLITPNCNEKLIVNDTAVVKWSGLLPADVIQLQYSTDNGRTWDTLATDITGLEYKWVVPDKVSDSCLVRVIQLWPNNVGQTMVLQHQAGVNCANFNQDGSFVITASKDNKNLVRIWNANNGQIIYELQGHTKPINWVSFDYQDKYAVSASDDSTAIIWDIKKGDFIRQLRGHRNIIRSANFSPSGNYIITAGADGLCLIWDVQSGQIIDSSFTSGYSLWYAAFSPDEKYVVLTDNYGQSSIFNFSGHERTHIFYTSVGVVPYAAFSQDMKKFTACSWFGQATVWDFNTGEELFTVVHDTNKVVPINSCTFDNTGNLLLTAGVDTVPRLWNANTGSEIATLLNEHTSAVQIATFNFDGKRILTASWDSTAKVWNREQIGLQVDTSDCTFSINRIKSDIKDITFGDTPVGTINDTIVSPFIENQLSFPLKINGYAITGTDSNDFEMINELPPYILNSKEMSSVGMRFKPSAPGLRKAQLEINVPGSKIISLLSGNGTLESIKLLSNVIDMGKVEIGDSKDSLLKDIIKNVSGQIVTIDSIEILGPDFFHFNITDNLSNKLLNPGMTEAFNLRFTPETAGRTNTVFRIYHDGNGKSKDLSVLGEGTLPRIDTAKIIIGSASGKPGDIVDIPVSISGLSVLGISPEITGFNLTLQFNSTLLAPLSDDKPVKITNG